MKFVLVKKVHTFNDGLIFLIFTKENNHLFLYSFNRITSTEYKQTSPERLLCE